LSTFINESNQNSTSVTDIKMLEVIRKPAKQNQEGKVNATLPRMVVAFAAGMVITAVLAYVPVITDILARNLSQESAVPAPSSAPGFLESGGSPDDSHPVKQNMSALVYALLQEGIFPL